MKPINYISHKSRPEQLLYTILTSLPYTKLKNFNLTLQYVTNDIVTNHPLSYLTCFLTDQYLYVLVIGLLLD